MHCQYRCKHAVFPPNVLVGAIKLTIRSLSTVDSRPASLSHDVERWESVRAHPTVLVPPLALSYSKYPSDIV
jgi:hypothetical protein